MRALLWRPRWPVVVLCGALVLPLWAQDATRTLRVGAGDSATALAQQIKPAEATLEQTLLALWRANPQAFVNGNLNLLREGATLRVPTRAEMLQTPADEARTAMVAQVAHVTAFARQLAMAQDGKSAHASVKPMPAATAVATPAPPHGAVATTPDAATLARALQEAQALQKALEKQNQDVQLQLQQLQHSIAALQRLSTPTPPAEAASAPPATNTPAPATETASAPPSSAASAPAEEGSASQSPVSAAEPTAVALPAQPPEPLVWAGGLLLALAVVALWVRWRRRGPQTAEATDIPPAMARIDLNLDTPPGGTDTRP